jgi:hypothetical protein
MLMPGVVFSMPMPSYENYNVHMAPLFRELDILPLHSQLQFSKLLLMHSIIYKYSPKSFKEYGQQIENKHKTMNFLIMIN